MSLATRTLYRQYVANVQPPERWVATTRPGPIARNAEANELEAQAARELHQANKHILRAAEYRRAAALARAYHEREWETA